jgi:hypothetical protein
MECSNPAAVQQQEKITDKRIERYFSNFAWSVFIPLHFLPNFQMGPIS